MTDFAPRQDCNIDKAIEELKLALPITALRNIIDRRAKAHRPVKVLRRRLEMLRAIEIAEA